MDCQYCGKEIPDDSKFCLSCGHRTTDQLPAVTLPQKPPLDESTETKSMLLVSFGAMLLFFGFGFLFPAVIMGGGWWLVVIPLTVLGAILFGIRWAIVSSYRTQIARLQTKVEKALTCEYCGHVNDPGAERCLDCGAPLPIRH